MSENIQPTLTHCHVDCNDVAQRLPWLLNGTLNADENEAVTAHLASCEACSRELEETIDAWSLFAADEATVQAPTNPAPINRVAPRRLERRIPRRARHLALAAGLAVALFGGTVVWRSAAPVSQPEVQSVVATTTTAPGELLTDGFENGLESWAVVQGEMDAQPAAATDAAPQQALLSSGFESGDLSDWVVVGGENTQKL